MNKKIIIILMLLIFPCVCAAETLDLLVDFNAVSAKKQKKEKHSIVAVKPHGTVSDILKGRYLVLPVTNITLSQAYDIMEMSVYIDEDDGKKKAKRKFGIDEKLLTKFYKDFDESTVYSQPFLTNNIIVDLESSHGKKLLKGLQ